MRRLVAALAASLAALFVLVTPTYAKVWQADCKHGANSYTMIYDEQKNAFSVKDEHGLKAYKSYGVTPTDDYSPRVYLGISGITANNRDFEARFVRPFASEQPNEVHPEPDMTISWRDKRTLEKVEATDKCTQENSQ